jgi:hypothetical protein
VEPVDPHKLLLGKIEKYNSISDEKYEAFFEGIFPLTQPPKKRALLSRSK